MVSVYCSANCLYVIRSTSQLICRLKMTDHLFCRELSSIMVSKKSLKLYSVSLEFSGVISECHRWLLRAMIKLTVSSMFNQVFSYEMDEFGLRANERCQNGEVSIAKEIRKMMGENLHSKETIGGRSTMYNLRNVF